jgi:hypothetical protein
MNGPAPTASKLNFYFRALRLQDDKAKFLIWESNLIGQSQPQSHNGP